MLNFRARQLTTIICRAEEGLEPEANVTAQSFLFYVAEEYLNSIPATASSPDDQRILDRCRILFPKLAAKDFSLPPEMEHLYELAMQVFNDIIVIDILNSGADIKVAHALSLWLGIMFGIDEAADKERYIEIALEIARFQKTDLKFPAEAEYNNVCLKNLIALIA